MVKVIAVKIKFLFFLVFLVCFNFNLYAKNNVSIETITSFTENYKKNLSILEVVNYFGESCYNEAQGKSNNFINNENCVNFKKLAKVELIKFGKFNLEYLEIINKILNRNASSEAINYFERNLYIYKKVNGELREVYLTEWYKILTNQTLDISRKLQLQGFNF